MFKKRLRVHYINGRRIGIENKSRADKATVDLIKKQIIYFCQNDERLRIFRNIKFILFGGKLKSESEYGKTIYIPGFKDRVYSETFLDGKEILKGKCVIHINASEVNAKMINNGANYANQDIKKSISHQITNIWNFFRSVLIEYELESKRDFLTRMDKKLFSEKSLRLNDIDFILKVFMNRVFYDGFKKYCENLISRKKYLSQNRFRELYNKAKKDAREINREFTKLRKLKEDIRISSDMSKTQKMISSSEKKIKKMLKQKAESIGEHICFSMLYHHADISTYKISRLKPSSLIKKYEKRMRKEQLQLVISINNEESIIKYKDMVNIISN